MIGIEGVYGFLLRLMEIDPHGNRSLHTTVDTTSTY